MEDLFIESAAFIFAWGLMLGPALGGIVGLIGLVYAFVCFGRAFILFTSPTPPVSTKNVEPPVSTKNVEPPIPTKKPSRRNKRNAPVVYDYDDKYKLPELPFA